MVFKNIANFGCVGCCFAFKDIENYFSKKIEIIFEKSFKNQCDKVERIFINKHKDLMFAQKYII